MSPKQASQQLDCEPPKAKPRPGVLVVEDEAMLRETLKDMLDALGYDVVAACGRVEEAIEAAGEANIDLRPSLPLDDRRRHQHHSAQSGGSAPCQALQTV
jgi:CheY-like chemotaxis protein